MESPQPYAIRYTTYSPQEAANLLLRISFEDKASQNHCVENEYWLKQYNLLQGHKQILLKQ